MRIWTRRVIERIAPPKSTTRLDFDRCKSSCSRLLNARCVDLTHISSWLSFEVESDDPVDRVRVTRNETDKLIAGPTKSITNGRWVGHSSILPVVQNADPVIVAVKPLSSQPLIGSVGSLNTGVRIYAM